ncbi:hypothetical protein AVEN_215089-1 [Araneus ventricosus]|uniref:Uncharacterized protein n=1 Tax=Araneus ventricosus TaxID=182803 RepID=A0A4Y2WZS2_ARAVE|nr:hypothetical protein AVEN_215089-1 [Araneus ventricosus]
MHDSIPIPSQSPDNRDDSDLESMILRVTGGLSIAAIASPGNKEDIGSGISDLRFNNDSITMPSSFQKEVRRYRYPDLGWNVTFPHVNKGSDLSTGVPESPDIGSQSLSVVLMTAIYPSIAVSETSEMISS